ncbi:MAG: hypothetical protein ACW98F_07750, partial [Candidatus Hodarchaeales archaeon]
MSTRESHDVIAKLGLLAAMEKTDYEKISFGRIPFVWKKKINNLVKNNPDKAITTFFNNFRENNKPKQMVYGFEQLLPHSLVYIVNHLDELIPERFIQLLGIFRNSIFQDSILSLELPEQTLLLDYIVQNWELCDKTIVKSILGQLNPNLSEEKYKTFVATQNKSLVELLIFWVESDVRVLYLVLQSYIQQPIDLIIPLFRKIPSDTVISACSSQNLPTKLSPNKIKSFLKIFDITNEELTYLISQFSTGSGKAQQHFVNWLISKNTSNLAILEVIPLKHQTQTSPLFISYFSQVTQNEAEKEITFLAEIIESSLFTIASSVLNHLTKTKNSHGITYLFTLIRLLEKNLRAYTNFFVTEFQKYSNNEEQRIIGTYFETKNENISTILLPSLISLKTPQWKKLINQIIEKKYFNDSKRVFLLLESFDTKTITKVSKYIIKNKYIPQLSYLYENYSFFLPLLTTTSSIEPTIYAQLVNFMKAHFKTHFEEIIPLGKKITFPMSTVASVFNKQDIIKLVSCVELEKKLLEAWEEVFLLQPNESLPLFLEKFQKKSKKDSEPLINITKKLIDIDIMIFWRFISSISNKSLRKYKFLLKYSLEKSIPILGEVITSLPSSHTAFLEGKIIPEFTTKSDQMLYAILSIQEASFFKN